MCPITLTINSQKLGRSNEQTRWEFAVNLPKRRPRPPPCCRGWRPLPSCDDPQWDVWWNKFLIHSQASTAHLLKFGHEQFHPTLYNGYSYTHYNYLCMISLKLIHDSKRAPWENNFVTKHMLDPNWRGTGHCRKPFSQRQGNFYFKVIKARGRSENLMTFILNDASFMDKYIFKGARQFYFKSCEDGHIPVLWDISCFQSLAIT